MNHPQRPIVRYAIAAAALGVCTLAVAALAPRSRAQDAAQVSARHVNQISPAAKAALAKYAALVYAPAGSGLKSAAGSVALDLDGDEAIASFTFRAPRTMHVDWTKAGAAKVHPQSMLGMIDMVLTAAFTGVPIPDESEYDAELVHDAAGDALDITTYRGDAARVKMHVVLDANGLAKSLTMTSAAPATAAQTVARTMTYELGWEKCGDKYRVTKLGFPGGGIGAPGGMTLRLSYDQVGKHSIATAWTVDATLGKQAQSLHFCLTALDLDGVPAELPKRALSGAK